MEVKDILGELTRGIYRREGKYRFGCEVEIQNKIENCYVSSSAKLEQFVALKGKEVRLIKNLGNTKNKYTLWSVKYGAGEIILDLNRVNLVIENLIRRKNLLFKDYKKITREKKVGDFKSDLVIEMEEYMEIIEIKTIISLEEIALFPNLQTYRAIEQLKKIESLLKQGLRVTYMLIALSPYIRDIEINPEYKDYRKYYNRCVKLGMRTFKIKLRYEKYSIDYEFIE